ncbi:replication factor C small subunit [Candidatus Woesearchaeota archaeon]|nr:replication factor C small subunit [Candidatus Woesearchaeota archaeon]
MEHKIWTEKYRPKSFAEIRGHREIIDKIASFVKQKNMPHLLFAGPAGVGKSTTALAIARELFGDEWRQNFLELNASDERGIDVVRIKVKDFARTRAIGNVPFKIIFLDECDALTKEAQQALRRTMENYTEVTRFVLSANYASKIIDPIQSRCAVFRFKPLGKEEVIELVETIAAGEHLSIDPAAKEALFAASDGDCRKVENILQSCAAITNHITEETIYAFASVAKPKEIREILETAYHKDFVRAKEQLLKVMLNYGLSGTDVIKQIQSELIHSTIADTDKLFLIGECGEAEFRITEGSDEYLQLEAFLAKVALRGKK